MNVEDPADREAAVAAVRAAGFTAQALDYPRDEFALVLLCAFNGVPPRLAPEGWRYFPCELTLQAWGRVADAAREFLAQGERRP